MVYYQPTLKKYTHDRILLFSIGKNECKKLRREAFLADNNYVMKEFYYDESLKAEFYM